MSRRRWVLNCKECRTECVYAEIPSTGIANYFLPKKPEVPKDFTFICPTCGHEDTYDRSDLTYQDGQISASPAVANCSEASGLKKRAAGAK
jgi:hypothetical protein